MCPIIVVTTCSKKRFSDSIFAPLMRLSDVHSKDTSGQGERFRFAEDSLFLSHKCHLKCPVLSIGALTRQKNHQSLLQWFHNSSVRFEADMQDVEVVKSGDQIGCGFGIESAIAMPSTPLCIRSVRKVFTVRALNLGANAALAVPSLYKICSV
jgi:hypothetical protein